MKKLNYILLSLLLLFFCKVNPAVIYRLANEQDAENILNIYDNFSKEDKNKLLVFPKREIQKKVILKNIENKFLFVVIDTDTQEIIAFLKLCILGENEILEILKNELCFSLESNIVSVNIFKDKLNKYDFKNYLYADQKINNILKNSSKDCLYIYHGAAYTCPEYRGRGHSTNLLKFAFEDIKNNFLFKTTIVLLYGQVIANLNNSYMISVFADCVSNYFESKIVNILHLQSIAYKPEFDEDGALKLYKDELHEGRGNMVICFLGDN
ncbi:hypothetical protein KJ644_04065 [Candidatus Dependentiae bacterium]|nr:hypothetical protein [Candidatus Dependentiae bacterium]MBU4387621.1 hypothetical protein [Candidatus Dependentiae bacterium]MCG2756466.1 hypothetical protein [Candidatus Dependentiae bacterium]